MRRRHFPPTKKRNVMILQKEKKKSSLFPADTHTNARQGIAHKNTHWTSTRRSQNSLTVYTSRNNCLNYLAFIGKCIQLEMTQKTKKKKGKSFEKRRRRRRLTGKKRNKHEWETNEQLKGAWIQRAIAALNKERKEKEREREPLAIRWIARSPTQTDEADREPIVCTHLVLFSLRVSFDYITTTKWSVTSAPFYLIFLNFWTSLVPVKMFGWPSLRPPASLHVCVCIIGLLEFHLYFTEKQNRI